MGLSVHGGDDVFERLTVISTKLREATPKLREGTLGVIEMHYYHFEIFSENCLPTPKHKEEKRMEYGAKDH